MSAISITDEHRRRNSETRGRWEAVATHRARVMELLCEARGENGRTLCVLGPGNGNDIELARLAAEFEKVALVDLDEAAVGRAVSRLDDGAGRRVERFCPVDLSGVLPVLESWRREGRPTDEEISAVKRAVLACSRPEVGAFDVVASTCILTQLIDAVYMSLPTGHPRCVELLTAVRNRHLEMVLELLNPNGVGVLVTDFVVAEPGRELAPLGELVLSDSGAVGMKQSEYFVGTDPFEIRDYYRGLPGPGATAGDVKVRGPWRWEVGGRVLGVCAVVFRRCG